MQLYCRQCGKEIQAENINIDKMIAKCSACNAVFSFADMYEGTLGKPKASYEDLPIPDGITVQQEMDYLLIEKKWSRTTAIFLILFSIIWNGMIWGIFIPSSYGADFTFNLFLIPFVLIGIFVAYMGFGNLLNTTIIRVDNEALDIKHVPLPFPSKRIAVSDIQQLYTRQRISRGKNGTTVSYWRLFATMEQNKTFYKISKKRSSLSSLSKKLKIT